MMKKFSLFSVIGLSTLGGVLALEKNHLFADTTTSSIQASFSENVDGASLDDTQTYDEEIAEEKAYFQNKYGFEDKFYTLEEEDKISTSNNDDQKVKEEFNPVTGVLRITDEKTGKVEESNYYEDIKPIEETTTDSEITDENSLDGTQTYEEEVAEEKAYFQNKYGFEDKFYTLEEEDKISTSNNDDQKVKEEFNPVTGVLRITDEKTGKVEESNYYEDIKPIEEATTDSEGVDNNSFDNA